MSGERAVSESSVRAAHELRTVFSRVLRQLKAQYDTQGLTPSQTSVLSRLSRDGSASTTALATAEGVRHQSMAATLAELERRGLVVRRPDPDDGRRQLLAATDAGHEFLEDGRAAGEEWLTSALDSRLGESERQCVLDALALLGRLVEP